MEIKTITIITSTIISGLALLVTVYVSGYLSGIARLQPLVESCIKAGGM